MRLETTVQPRDVHEALRLFKVSTMNAASATPQTSGLDLKFLGDAERLQIQNAEQFVKQRLRVGADAKTVLLMDEGVALGHGNFALTRAIRIMGTRAELAELDKGRRLRRLR